MLTTDITWDDAVHAVAARAKLALDKGSHDRIDRAVQIVLSGGVRLVGPHSAQVASQSQPTRDYLVNGTCGCLDLEAPSALCKHKLAVQIYRRAMEQATPPSATSCAPLGFEVPVSPAVKNMPGNMPTLPEAPASVNVRLMIQGHEAQFTLRDTDEYRLLARLLGFLECMDPHGEQRTPTTAPTQPTRSETPVCATHGPMRESTKAQGTYFCTKKLYDGSYRKSRWPER